MTTIGAVTIIERDTLTDGTTVFVARDSQFPACMAHGSTPDEAAENLVESRELFFEDIPVELHAPTKLDWKFGATVATQGASDTLVQA